MQAAIENVLSKFTTIPQNLLFSRSRGEGRSCSASARSSWWRGSHLLLPPDTTASRPSCPKRTLLGNHAISRACRAHGQRAAGPKGLSACPLRNAALVQRRGALRGGPGNGTVSPGGGGSGRDRLCQGLVASPPAAHSCRSRGRAGPGLPSAAGNYSPHQPPRPGPRRRRTQRAARRGALSWRSAGE